MVEHDAPPGLRSLALALLAAALPPADDSSEARYLRSHAAAVQVPDFAAALDRYLSSPRPEDEALLRLSRRLELHRIELMATAIAVGVETDLMSGRAIAHLQAPIGGSRPTLGLLSVVLAPLEDTQSAMTMILTGAAVESGLLRILNDTAPLAERSICLPVPLCFALGGEASGKGNTAWPGTTSASAANAVTLPPSVVSEAETRARGLGEASHTTFVVRSGSRPEAKSVACVIAESLGLKALFIDADKQEPAGAFAGLGPWMMLQGRLPVYCYEMGPGERKTLPALPRYRGAQLALCGLEGRIELADETVPSWTLGVAAIAERRQLWEVALGKNHSATRLLAQFLAVTHRHGTGRIAQLGRLARYQGSLHGRTDPRLEDVLAASWNTDGTGLDALAQSMPDRIPDAAMVMTPTLREELDRLLLRCRWREGLTNGLGASAAAKYRPGVRALFTGQSGTGKTLAAGWVATRLGMPIYRVDLAAVTNKYIGETEKNLAQLLSRAEHAEVILLFDEADSMFGKRTDVKESNDRFANAQTNYLLQRIESFDGIVFLTSNSRARFDPAFFRRLDTIIEFPVPGPAERRALWQSHLGTAHLLTQSELNQLAAAADLLGGQIRNAVFTAAVLARSGSRQITYADVIEALGDEYRKLGRQVPSDLRKSA